MDKRQNVLSLICRKGYCEVPVHLNMCPSLKEQFRAYTGFISDLAEYFGFSWRNISDLQPISVPYETYHKYYDFELKPGTKIDRWGVTHEPGSESACHMTYMRHPLAKAKNVEDMPYGTSEEVRSTVFRNLRIAGEKGGLIVAPTHVLEPEVPLENVFAYVQAYRDYIK